MPLGRVEHPRRAFQRVFRNNNELPVRAPLLSLVRDSWNNPQYTENLATTFDVQSTKLYKKKSFLFATESWYFYLIRQTDIVLIELYRHIDYPVCVECRCININSLLD